MAARPDAHALVDCKVSAAAKMDLRKGANPTRSAEREQGGVIRQVLARVARFTLRTRRQYMHGSGLSSDELSVPSCHKAELAAVVELPRHRTSSTSAARLCGTLHCTCIAAHHPHRGLAIACCLAGAEPAMEAGSLQKFRLRD